MTDEFIPWNLGSHGRRLQPEVKKDEVPEDDNHTELPFQEILDKVEEEAVTDSSDDVISSTERESEGVVSDSAREVVASSGTTLDEGIAFQTQDLKTGISKSDVTFTTEATTMVESRSDEGESEINSSTWTSTTETPEDVSLSVTETGADELGEGNSYTSRALFI